MKTIKRLWPGGQRVSFAVSRRRTRLAVRRPIMRRTPFPVLPGRGVNFINNLSLALVSLFGALLYHRRAASVHGQRVLFRIVFPQIFRPHQRDSANIISGAAVRAGCRRARVLSCWMKPEEARGRCPARGSFPRVRRRRWHSARRALRLRRRSGAGRLHAGRAARPGGCHSGADRARAKPLSSTC